jgi:hypothetical protein
MEDAFLSRWIDFGVPGTEPVAGTVTPALVFELAAAIPHILGKAACRGSRCRLDQHDPLKRRTISKPEPLNSEFIIYLSTGYGFLLWFHILVDIRLFLAFVWHYFVSNYSTLPGPEEVLDHEHQLIQYRIESRRAAFLAG